MTELHQAAAGGKGADPLDFSDREAVRAWLRELRTQVAEIAAAGEDATRPPGKRALGRATARSTILEAQRAIEQMIATAEQGARGSGG